MSVKEYFIFGYKTCHDVQPPSDSGALENSPWKNVVIVA